MDTQSPGSALDLVAPHIQHTSEDDRFIVVMTCGIAGSGKTTLAKAILQHFPNFTRLSVDELVAKTHGIYGIDYPADKAFYARYLDEADAILNRTFQDLLKAKHDIVLDRSLYDKSDRMYYKKLVEEAGGRTVLVYFDPEHKELLWSRIQVRSQGEVGPNSAFKITRNMFEKYWEGFDIPTEEDRIVIEVTENRDHESGNILAGDALEKGQTW